MTVTETFNPEAPVDPEAWVILRPFMHEGITYGRNEVLPETVTGPELVGLMRIGVVTHRKPDGTLERPSMPKPETPAAYLRLSDAQVLRALREHHPSPEDLHEIAVLARRNRRSTLLMEALDAMAGIPPAQPRAVVQQTGDLQAELRSAIDSLEEERRHHAVLRSQHSILENEHRQLQQGHTSLEEQYRNLEEEHRKFMEDYQKRLAADR
jgi:hypothetical protein